MKVSVKPRDIKLASLLSVGLMILFPPWLYYDGYTSNQASAGYHFFLSSPAVTTYEEMFGFSTDMPTQFVQVRLNFLRLLVQIFTLWFLAGGWSLALRGDAKWMSGCLLSHGFLGILLLILLMSSKF